MQINPRADLLLKSNAARGFTLMELLIAMVLAGLLTGTALAFWQGTHSTHHHLVKTYLLDIETLIDEMRQVHPYGPDRRRRNLPQ